VGTGFHPELTGRENIFLNGAILGMGKGEITRKFDEIVAFAEVERFLDTPVKRYSSGMYVRLAFAVAAHLEPEILIVDEVLAVGDAQFQKKCLGKMEDVGKAGRTVIFVSHQMGAISTLCDTAILIEKGKLAYQGTTTSAVGRYLSSGSDYEFSNHYVCESGDKTAALNSISVISQDGSLANSPSVDEVFGILFQFEVKQETQTLQPNILFTSFDGQKIFHCIGTGNFSKPGFYSATIWIPKNFLNSIKYIVHCTVTTMNPVVIHASMDIPLDVLDNINAITRGDYRGEMHGLMRPSLEWSCQELSQEKFEHGHIFGDSMHLFSV
jgi:lipopolysaccharide transport system ATP-binding protein